jgi:hypothetical protein
MSKKTPGRYFSARDVRFMNSINGELLDDIIEQTVILFKFSPEVSTTNMYGESLEKVFLPGVCVDCLIRHEDEQTVDEGAGPDVRKIASFAFHRKLMELKSAFPEPGDIIYWEDVYYELDEIKENQLLGGQWKKNFSIVLQGHRTRLSKLNVQPRQK